MITSLRLKAVVLVLSIMFVGVQFQSCHGGDDSMAEAVRPECEQALIKLRVGETVTTRVLNASVVEVVDVPDVVEASVDGTLLSVTGVEAGEGSILLLADGQRLWCGVSVINVQSLQPEPETAEDVARQLADATLRMSVGRRVLCYASVGTLFSLSGNRQVLTATSLVTGETVSFSTQEGFGRSRQLAEPVSIPVSDISLSLNGDEMEVVSAEIACATSACTWFHLITSTGEPVWIVFPSGAL